MNLFLVLLNYPLLGQLCTHMGCSLDSVLIHTSFPGFSSIFCDPLIPSLILSFPQPLLFNSSVLSYSLSDSFPLLLFLFFFFPPIISRRLFCTLGCFCFLQVCPNITSCSGYMWCSQQEANVCTYNDYADFLHFVPDLLLLRSVFILAEQILSRLTQTNWAAMMPFFKPFYFSCFSFFLTVSCLISFLSPTGSNTPTLISSLFPDGLLQYRTTQRITVQQNQYYSAKWFSFSYHRKKSAWLCFILQTLNFLSV